MKVIKLYNSIFGLTCEKIEEIVSPLFSFDAFDLDAWVKRDLFTRKVGYALLTFDKIKPLKKFVEGKRLHEVCAGTGYAKFFFSLLNPRFYIQTDNFSSHFVPEKRFTDVEIVDSVLKEKELQSEVVLMSWPPFDETFARDIALVMRKGATLIYIGEGRGGCTGDDSFFKEVEKFRGLGIFPIVNFPGIHDKIFVFRK